MACKVKVNQHGFLAFHLFWNGQRSWEGTGLKDTAKNWRRVEARAVLISEEMENGTFDYLERFPDGNKANFFKPKEDPATLKEKPKQKTVGEYYQDWIVRKKPPFVRRSLERDYRQHFGDTDPISGYILPQFADTPLSDVTIPSIWRLSLTLFIYSPYDLPQIL